MRLLVCVKCAKDMFIAVETYLTSEEGATPIVCSELG